MSRVRENFLSRDTSYTARVYLLVAAAFSQVFNASSTSFNALESLLSTRY
jgi:hypothetical protein